MIPPAAFSALLPSALRLPSDCLSVCPLSAFPALLPVAPEAPEEA